MMRVKLLATAAVVTLFGAPMALADATQPVTAGLSICGDALGPRVADGGPIRMVSGFGTESIAVDTDVPQAQAWFDQGLRLRWAFEHHEAVRAFQKARELDPQCGMCAWGEAVAMGANLNYDVDAATQSRARDIARDAKRLSRDAVPWQRAMIDALQARYAGRMAGRNKAYADAMERVRGRFPDEIALATLTADALMIAEDDWFDAAKVPAPRMSRALGLIEGVLADHPDDPAAIHLYIHATEYSRNPEKAEPFADRLGALTPGSPHLLHMPAHTYYTLGRYKDAARVNVRAIDAGQKYDAAVAPPGGLTAIGIHGHNLFYGLASAQVAGDAVSALKLADHLFVEYPVDRTTDPYAQLRLGSAYLSYGLFSDRAHFEDLPTPEEAKFAARALWLYADGELAAREGNIERVRTDAAAIAALRHYADQAHDRRSAEAMLELPQRVLEGRAALMANDAPAAVAAFRRAQAMQLIVEIRGDPPLWWAPVRRSLGVALMRDGQLEAAQRELEASLLARPRDPGTLFALSELARERGDFATADRRLAEAREQWLGGAFYLALT